MKLFLKGERCLTEKCAIERRAYPPGEHGRGRIKQSEYLLQLREKQKARRYYGLLEKQFRNYYDKATAGTGITGREPAAACSRRGSTTSSTGSASPPRAPRRASSSATATSSSTAAGSTSRASSVRPDDVITMKHGLAPPRRSSATRPT